MSCEEEGKGKDGRGEGREEGGEEGGGDEEGKGGGGGRDCRRGEKKAKEGTGGEARERE